MVINWKFWNISQNRNWSFSKKKWFIFYSKSKNFQFLTTFQVKMGNILLKRKNATAIFFEYSIVSDKLPKINKKFKKSWGHIDLFLPWSQNFKYSPRHCVSPKISNFGTRHIYLIGTFHIVNNLVLCQKSGFTNIGLLSQQYS